MNFIFITVYYCILLFKNDFGRFWARLVQYYIAVFCQFRDNRPPLPAVLGGLLYIYIIFVWL